MARGLSYRDAAVLLGGGPETKVVAALDKLLGGALLLATAGGAELALSLFDAKGELSKLCADLIGGVGERVRGLNRYDRTRRLEAAHAVVVLAAFFECTSRVDLPQMLRPTKAEQVTLAAGDRLSSLLELPPALPEVHVPHDQTIAQLAGLYRAMAREVSAFAMGLADWDSLTKINRSRVAAELEAIPAQAIVRYGELFRRLAVEFPEFGYWANMLDHQATRAEIRRMDIALAGMSDTLTRLRIGREPAGIRLALARRNASVLRRPGLAFGDMSTPTIGRCYVNPNFRVGQPRPEEITRPDWWQERPLRTDIQDFLVGHLTSPTAAEAPLVVLGHPGAGKSLLTQMLAARLPASDFLTVRVPLREVPADADLQTQIEMRIRADSGTTTTWPELVATAGDAMPVVLLDGFDELLQATGQSQSNYLERIAAFQLRESELGRPVAVLVTSRLTVADRARPVNGAVTLLLEPFDDRQVELWLTAWNETNSAALTVRELHPLKPETALRYRDLACQPLLLLLLALYDSDGNGLHNEETLNEAELYERLLTGFTRREVRKSAETLTDSQVDGLVAREMLYLSVVAFAMFNRNQLWVTEAQLDADLRVLLGEPSAADSTRLTAAELLVGRFYFVYVAQAVHDQKHLRTYEFLHATFGEFLVARLVVQELRNLLAAASVSTMWSPTSRVDDQFLHATLSYAPITMRRTVVAFIDNMIGDDETFRDLLLGLFRAAMQARNHTPLDEYRPVRASVPGRVAVYSANLFVLLAVAAGEVTSRELFPEADDHAAEWARVAQLWHSQLPSEGWRTLYSSIDVHREWDGDQRLVRLSSVVRLDDSAPVPELTFDPQWTYNYSPNHENGPYSFVHDSSWHMLAETGFTGGRLQEAAMHNLLPFVGELDTMLLTFHDTGGHGMVSAGRALIELWLASGYHNEVTLLTNAYGICIRIAMNGFGPDDHHTRNAFRNLVLHQLANDKWRLPAGWLRETVKALQTKHAPEKGAEQFLQLLLRKAGLN
ncbi:NACHT domain-containing NTPase [Kutzneria sp. 744]|uniref:NACHT domain-containing protein n=1 Tax=Kutzneria sp. (strain 744) TaxID=345341 RepID=UPI0003EED7F5|nr:AAA family ATPase [Kutzneria sp. 744]EWM19604.1 ATPase [Kutzneria sp. 744]